MTISFRCACGRPLETGSEDAGLYLSCPACGQSVLVPGDTAVRPASAAPPPPSPGRRDAITPGRQPAPRRLSDDEWEEEPAPSGPPRLSGKAMTSLVLGLLSFLCTLVTAIPAIILGILSLRDISRSQGRLTGQGLAIAGIILGGLGSVSAIPLILVALLIPAVQKGREAATRAKSMSNLRQISLAMLMYHDTMGRFPPAVVYDRNGKPLYSWRVLLLPYLEENNLYRQFHLDEPWDSPHNKQLLASMPSEYADPGSTPPREPYATHYQLFVGPGAAFESDPRLGLQPFGGAGIAPDDLRESSKPTRLVDIRDGTRSTFLIVEAADPVPWSQPGDIAYDPQGPLPRLGLLGNGEFNAAMADVSVHHFQRGTEEKLIRAYITRDGGEVVPPPP
jgi:hypothetical protein